MITADDVVLAISYSGESDEIGRILPIIKRRGAKVIAITGKSGSTLAREADIHLDARVEKEACPLELAPTASTTATLALGDALAMALLDARGFESGDFAMHHPGGALGRRLLVHVSDIMRKGEQLPTSRASDMLVPTVLEEMSLKGIGMTCVVDGDGRLAGVITDGDLRRYLVAAQASGTAGSILDRTASDLMTRNPVTVGRTTLAVEALRQLEQRKITSIVVVDEERRVQGVVHLHDLWRTQLF
jgi:arabinose-5-phosphate isomerase